MLSNQRSIYRKTRYNQAGLQLWIDATAVDRFTVDVDGYCSQANDRTQFVRHFTQGTLANQPLYVLNAINSLPALRFDGTDDFMDFSDPTLTWLDNSSFTIFYVATKTGQPSNAFIMGGTNASQDSNLALGYINSSTHTVVFGADNANSIVPVAAPGEAELYTITFDATDNSRVVRRNGTVYGLGASSGQLSNMTGQALGRYLGQFGQFDLGELIIYDRPLEDYERSTVERDLISKWTIPVATEYVPPAPVIPTGTAFSVSNDGMVSYTINGEVDNPTITVTRGSSHTFSINAPGHPFHIQTVSGGYSVTDEYIAGLTGEFTDNGDFVWVVPENAPDTLYYACEFHEVMAGTITVVD